MRRVVQSGAVWGRRSVWRHIRLACTGSSATLSRAVRLHDTNRDVMYPDDYYWR